MTPSKHNTFPYSADLKTKMDWNSDLSEYKTPFSSEKP